jgi:hypothetical protein
MNIDDLTLGQIKQLQSVIAPANKSSDANIVIHGIDDFQSGKIVIVRTFSAGVFAGTLSQKHRDEVVLKNARRMWQWHCDKSISLSAVAVHGINQSKSRIAPAVTEIWLQPIEIIPFSTMEAEKSVMEAANAVAQ